jgi:hypothetical protein
MLRSNLGFVKFILNYFQPYVWEENCIIMIHGDLNIQLSQNSSVDFFFFFFRGTDYFFPSACSSCVYQTSKIFSGIGIKSLKKQNKSTAPSWTNYINSYTSIPIIFLLYFLGLIIHANHNAGIWTLVIQKGQIGYQQNVMFQFVQDGFGINQNHQKN